MKLYIRYVTFVVAFVMLGAISSELQAQRRKRNKEVKPTVPTLSFEEDLYNGLKWRSIGPYRGGRSCAVTGVPGKPNLFYFGSTGGGIWRTKDGGQSWENISDGFFGGSIGAIAVSKSDNNIIFAGGGEKTVRGNVSYGYGIWKSMDAGKTWASMGLKNSRHVGRIRIHPKNPDIVYAAVMGDLYKATEERGVYKSTDGGNSWKKVLFANENAGAVDLVIDPSNPRVLYASTWRIRRTPYSLLSGGEGSSIWKSTDGGDTWKEIMANPGLPKGPIGIVGITVSPVNSERVWALIEAKNGGVYRSDNGGESWTKLNESRALRQRAWYYTRIYADTKDEDVVYVMNVSYHKSTDGGRSFKSSNAPHGDHHDLWIAPEDPSRMIIGDDGGAQVSFDGGKNWSTYHNQPTAQFYRVTTDNHFPYRIYAAQQDNSTVRIAHRNSGSSIGERDWEPTAGGESAHIAVDPLDNDVVYGGSYGGFLTRVNHETEETRAINVWPDNPMGYGAEGMRYRFQWNFPIFFSPHDPQKLYTTSNRVHVSKNGGQSWEIISPDLTRNDADKLKSSGGPITQDNTGVEYYCTIFAACESPYEKDLLWAGSDDGLVHISKNGGESWDNVSPAGMPEWMMINSIDPDPFTPGGAYVAGTRYKLGDYKPYLYRTKDYGQSWELIVDGIEGDHFTRVLRADPERKGLLYAGTETGMYVSFDDGNSWKPFQLNLPIVPITDLTIKNNNLIAATQGRSLWLIDDLTPLHQLSEKMASKDAFLYKPMDSYRMRSFGFRQPRSAGRNHPGGVITYFYLKEMPDSSSSVSLAYYDQAGNVIKEWSTAAKKKNEKLKVKKGMNEFNWNMMYPDAKRFDGLIMWAGSTSGPMAVPGTYEVRLTMGEETMSQTFNILKDPRTSASIADIQEQFDFLMQVRDKLSETHQAIMDIRTVKGQVKQLNDRIGKDESFKEISDLAKEITDEISDIEKELYQTKNQSRQDPLNFPIKLNNKLAHLGSLNGRSGDFKPTDQSKAFYKEVSGKIDEQLEKWQQIRESKIPDLNKKVNEKTIDAISLKKDSPKDN